MLDLMEGFERLCLVQKMRATPCLVLADNPSALIQVCGISAVERLLRTLQRCGIKQAIVLSSTPELIAQELAQPSWARAELDVNVCGRAAGPVTIEQIVDLWPEDADHLLVFPADMLCDCRLLQLLISRNEPAAVVDSAVPAGYQTLVASAPETTRGKLCGPALIQRGWALGQTGPLLDVLRRGLEDQTLAAIDVAAEPLYYSPMRRKLRPYWFPAPAPDRAKLAEYVLLDATQKGTLDIPALVHAPIETFLISLLCKTSITPNQLTIFTNIVAWIATVLFLTGRLGWGLVLALIVGVLDGLDGKQARVKVETTKRGKLEHWFDALFEWSWWIALAYYFRASGLLPDAFRYLALLAAAEAVDGILKGSIYFTTGKLIDELGSFERMVRLVGGRRNVYVWILTAGFLVGAPAKAFVLMALLQTATAAVHLPRALWTLLFRRNNQFVGA
jgi:1L-myo-inositol 1-phosphate cytidylyltransferase / CDP-L-myo-inositol myo-inositolphosphotransferase